MMSPTQWDAEMITDLQPHSSVLCETKMMGIIGLRPAYQAWLPANIQSVFSVSYSFHAPDITSARNRNPY